jgi:hypothetical protein
MVRNNNFEGKEKSVRRFLNNTIEEERKWKGKQNLFQGKPLSLVKIFLPMPSPFARRYTFCIGLVRI